MQNKVAPATGPTERYKQYEQYAPEFNICQRIVVTIRDSGTKLSQKPSFDI